MRYAPTATQWTAATHAILTSPVGNVVVLVDSGVPENVPFLAHLRTVIGSLGRDFTLYRIAPHADLNTVEYVHSLISMGTVTVAVGGGSLLDAVKLARLWSVPGFLERLNARTRSGFVALRPMGARPASTLVAIPTTLGTGSESSPVAIVDLDGRRRLVSGAQLRPDACVLLADAVATLSEILQREGVVEVLLRIAGSLIGDDGDIPLRDALSPVLCRLLIDALRNGLDDATRACVLRVGALSRNDMMSPHNPYGARAWYISTELSAALGVRKMEVLPAVTIGTWRMIEAGDERWGSHRGLCKLYSQLSGETQMKPSEWLSTLMHDAGIATRINVPPGMVSAITDRTLRAWGKGLPMLPDFEFADVRRLVVDVSQ